MNTFVKKFVAGRQPGLLLGPFSKNVKINVSLTPARLLLQKRNVSKSGQDSIMVNHANDPVTLDKMITAADRIRPIIHKTPVMTNKYASMLSGRNLFFKCENLQKTGSFKMRGAANSVMRLKELRGDDAFTVVTHSSGNHGQALACAAAMNGVECIVVVPSIAPEVKKDAIKGYGAKLLECGPSAEARQRMVDQTLVNLKGKGEYVPSADHPFMMEGSASAAIELMEEVPDLDAIIVCCGTGGFLAGIASYCHERNPSVKVFAAEPKLADDTARSFAEGRRIVLTEYPKTIADGLRMSVGEYTWPIIQSCVSDVVTVSDEEIVKAMLVVWERMKLVVEPSGVVAFAAVLTEKFKSLPKDIRNVGITFSGGNLDLQKLPWMVESH